MENKRLRFLIIIGVILLLLDQLTKLLFSNFHYDLWAFRINPVQNTGVSFGMLAGTNSIMIGVSLAIMLLIFYFRREFKGREIFLVLIASGTIGNLIDRIFRGFVIDFVDFGWWPVFNIADSCLCIGVVGFMISILLFNKRNALVPRKRKS